MFFLIIPTTWWSTLHQKILSLVLVRQKDGSPIEIPGSMKQHLIIFKPKQTIFCKEYLCDCASCLQFDFENCNSEVVYDAAGVDDDGTGCKDENDEEIDQTEHILEFITVPSFVSLYYGSSIEPLYFVHATGKVLQKRTYLLYTDTLLKRARDIFKGCILNWFDLEMQS